MSTSGERGRCPAAEPTTVVESLSSQKLGSLKPNGNINTPLHPKVTHLQCTTTPHWACALYSFWLYSYKWRERILHQSVTKECMTRVTQAPPKQKEIVWKKVKNGGKVRADSIVTAGISPWAEPLFPHREACQVRTLLYVCWILLLGIRACCVLLWICFRSQYYYQQSLNLNLSQFYINKDCISINHWCESFTRAGSCLQQGIYSNKEEDLLRGVPCAVGVFPSVSQTTLQSSRNEGSPWQTGQTQGSQLSWGAETPWQTN